MQLTVFADWLGGGSSLTNIGKCDVPKSATVVDLRRKIDGLLRQRRSNENISTNALEPAVEYRILVGGKCLLERGNTEGYLFKLYSDYKIRENSSVQLQKVVHVDGGSSEEGTNDKIVVEASNLKDVVCGGNAAASSTLIDGSDQQNGISNGAFTTEDSGENAKIVPVEESPVDDSAAPEENACDKCIKKPGRKCFLCNCSVCGIPKDDDKTLLCDGYVEGGLCGAAYHIYCLPEPLDATPSDDDWYCPDCVITRLKQTKGVAHSLNEEPSGSHASDHGKKRRLPPSATSSRNWGGGHSCAGVAVKASTDVNHRGPIPGIEVGQSWKYRHGVSGDGVHRPLQAGIHSNTKMGALSIVVSGGYQDDSDKGDEVLYTGEGGRNFEGNTRSSEQVKDQTLTKGNLGLAMCCYGFKLETHRNGGNAGKDWRRGRPIRLVRGCSANKNKKIRSDPSKYEPTEGYRYDGIYKVVRFYKEKSPKHGFIIWRYVLRRDDVIPAPWTKEGRERIQRLNLRMKVPDGVDDGQSCASSPSTRPKGNSTLGDEEPECKRLRYKMPPGCAEAIDADTAINKMKWAICVKVLKETGDRSKFIAAMEEEFKCFVCMCLLKDATTFPCGHTICDECKTHMLRSEEVKCSMCRMDIGDIKAIARNEHLNKVLDDVHWKPVV